MKIGIITLHNSFSFGACLQAYATYMAVRQLGHEAVMIDYRNSYEQSQNHVLPTKKDISLKKRIVTVAENILLLKLHNQNRSFRGFHNIYEKTDYYSSAEEIQTQSFDCLISGSDQLWNPDIFGGIDTAFFLDFGSENCRRISYAASAGSHVFTDGEISLIYPLLKKYYAISVREEKLKKQIDSIIGINAKTVLDPTFLLPVSHWRQFMGEPLYREHYILLYMIGVPYSEYKTKYAPVVRFYSEKLNLPVFGVSQMSFVKTLGVDRALCGLTPQQLIRAINDADLVITSSFHGVAFSVQLNRRFAALKTENPDRVNCLLESVGLENRIIDGLDEKKCISLLNEIDYSEVNQKLGLLKEDSLSWLRRQLDYEQH